MGLNAVCHGAIEITDSNTMSKRSREDEGVEGDNAPVGGDSNDVTLSVDATNKLRAELGLRPLDEQKTDEAKENWLKEEAQRTEAAAADELKKKLEKAKNKRELNKKSKKKSIAEEAREAGEDMSAADEEAYDATDLSGLKVAHNTSELQDGSTVILTLKDEHILEGTGDQINLKKYEDELENVNLKDNQVAKRNAKRKAYDGGNRGHNPFDDHEFNEDGSINTSKRKILEKYDDDAERNREDLLDDKQQIVITETGAAVAAKSLIEDEVGEEDEEAARMKRKISETLQVKFQAIKEQYTADEMASFKKPAGQKKM